MGIEEGAIEDDPNTVVEKEMRIVLIGPTYPFRGGIAHYTTLLGRTLRKHHEVTFVSFKRQYPAFLFPGRSDRDPSNEPLAINDVHFVIDPLNPLTWMTALRIIKESKADKIILPWWVTFWTLPFFFMVLMAKWRCRAHIVFICHNVIEHESNFLKRSATKMVLSQADRLITHSREETRRLRALVGSGVDAVTAFHPTYDELSDKRYPKQEAKMKLGLQGDVLLFFGFVRPYKGLNILLEALPIVLKEKRLTLVVAGEFWGRRQAYSCHIDRLNIRSHVRIIDRYIPNEEVGIYFAAADIVVQPYLSASGSGVCQLALGFDRPVIATQVGSLSEVIEDGVNGRLVVPNDAAALASAISESLEPATIQEFSRNAAKTKEKFTWESMAAIVTGEQTGPPGGIG